MTFAKKAIEYFTGLSAPKVLPPDLMIINPYKKETVKNSVKAFYEKYYNDNNNRIFIWGINPGRFGGGLTGIAFTDPPALNEFCGIENNLGIQRELSSKFIYEMIFAFGGVNKFFSKCFLTALYPLAIIKNDKNYNYYDEPGLFVLLKEDMVRSIKFQVEFGAVKDYAVCLGKKNYKYFKEINDEYSFFKNIEVVEHPRYIMQYKSKSRDIYIKKYLKHLTDH